MSRVHLRTPGHDLPVHQPLAVGARQDDVLERIRAVDAVALRVLLEAFSVAQDLRGPLRFRTIITSFLVILPGKLAGVLRGTGLAVLVDR